MWIKFNSDGLISADGFSINFYYTPIDTICKDWLNMTSGYLTSPDFPTIDCNWVITASMGSTIIIQFQMLEVHNILVKTIFDCLPMLFF